ncbi:MAG TPA: RNHCP domain-containing protein [Clostridiales bacterium]|jgi:DNA-directed RNA polymerase subunit RPC12/RpoP|nr:RNHCP domain-containing protein [Clostridiales bacterium]HBE14498.1 RNHCP domain-containing protein [Clostridiales bacterium]HCG34792.1 RNHCP domain-containing protein [Clostridiales bacterium]
MENKVFIKNDDGFVCDHCGKDVLPMGKSSRDHCPFCLYGLHVDIHPGDRANACAGRLKPIQSLPDPKKGFIIVYQCEKCKQTVRCKAALDCIQPDNQKKLIKLTVCER